jgi:hypothetical protein
VIPQALTSTKRQRRGDRRGPVDPSVVSDVSVRLPDRGNLLVQLPDRLHVAPWFDVHPETADILEVRRNLLAVRQRERVGADDLVQTSSTGRAQPGALSARSARPAEVPARLRGAQMETCSPPPDLSSCLPLSVPGAAAIGRLAEAA